MSRRSVKHRPQRKDWNSKQHPQINLKPQEPVSKGKNIIVKKKTK